MKATVCPRSALKLISCSTYSLASGYLKETLRNSTVPTGEPSGAAVSVPSVIFASVFSTSPMRRSETSARGRMTKIIASIMNAMMICIAYEENVIICVYTSPRSAAVGSASMRYAPTQ